MHRHLTSLFLFAILGPPALASAVPPQIDTMAKRTAACIQCHGAQGRSTGTAYYPRIAGKPEGYLFNQLINFREGRRINPAMNHLVEHLSDDYLREMAAYFAAQHLPYPAPARTTVAAATLERGKQLVTAGDRARGLPACIACHGQTLAGVAPALPGLLGLSRDYLNMQFGAWRNGVRRGAKPDCMANIARTLSPADVTAVTAWLSAQAVPQNYQAATSRAPLPMPCGGVQ